MNINFEYDKVSASDALEIFTAKKLEKLFNRYDFIVRADVFFKTENTSSDETGKICNIRLSAPGPRIFAEASNENFEKSVSESYNELKRQLQKRKEKMQTH
ncbi:MAG: ribosomal subunit interface protein [Flavobacteriaceae bacterium]|nr:ribosomal subunit interface protein [Flavobacteriaceae bacterium]|tara:strand:- start:24029 stop:24331 length:303 start_codon:yes stop_codon:yes gene_type:complete